MVLERVSMIEHALTNSIVCPYCGYKDPDSGDHDFGGDESMELDCGQCGKVFLAREVVSVAYTTYKIEEQT